MLFNDKFSVVVDNGVAWSANQLATTLVENMPKLGSTKKKQISFPACQIL